MSTDMTTQDDLAAGRELDAKVAKMMGWHDLRMDIGHGGSSLLVGVTPTSEVTCVPVPDYSTDISAAWTILDEMVWRVGTANIRLDMEDYGRGAGTGTGAERAVWVTIGEHTAVGPAPLAICKAALAASQEIR
jgi:hypothetical protein